jgi:hypothetical protein
MWKARPSFEDDDLVELLTLRLVHVHHDDTCLWLGVRGEMRRREIYSVRRSPDPDGEATGGDVRERQRVEIDRMRLAGGRLPVGSAAPPSRIAQLRRQCRSQRLRL